MKAISILVLLISLTAGSAFAQGSTSSSSSSTSTTASAKKKVTADAGLLMKLFKKAESYLGKVKKIEPDAVKAVEQHVQKKKLEYDHHYTHHRHAHKGDSLNIGKPDSLSSEAFVGDADDSLHSAVFGWHPYWMGEAYKAYNFNLLSTIAYFSYEVDPSTGGYKSIHDWKTTEMISLAREKNPNIKVLLTLTNFGITNNARFLNNKDAQETLADSVISLLKIQTDSVNRGDGVSIDFEGVSVKYAKEWNQFVEYLALKLHQADTNFVVSLTIYPIDEEGLYDFQTLNKYIDQYVMMGYDYYGATSKTAGPVAPLASGKEWWPWNIERSVKAYIKDGILRDKLLVAFPYYGALWQTEGVSVPSKAKEFIGHRPYSYIMTKIAPGNVNKFDTVSKSSYFAYPLSDSDKFRQCWYDSKESLHVKYQFIKKEGLGGVGIWALGFDNGQQELWQLLQEEFTGNKPDAEPSAILPELPSEAASLVEKIEAYLSLGLKYRSVLVISLFFMLLVVGISYLITMFDEDARSFYFSLDAFKYYVIGFFTVMVLIVSELMSFSQGTGLLFIGLVIGILLTMGAQQYITIKKRRLP